MIHAPARTDLLFRPIAFELPERLHELSAWIEHTPFAFWAVEAVRPRSLVELGSHSGVSYCAFCQAVRFLDLSTACYAIDTWTGDAHTNASEAAYADDVLADLRKHHDPRYGGFSTLVQSTFEEALPAFADGSVDLLHIDGYHTYEAVRGDFESWLPKLSDRAVVLFHDVNERASDFGAWRFWDEISARYPSFLFLHGHGLGVLAVGAEQSEAIRWLTGLDEADTAAVRAFFSARGREVQMRVDLQRAEKRWRATEVHAGNLDRMVEETRRQLEASHAESHAQLSDALTKLHAANLATQEVNGHAAYRQGVIDEAQRRIAALDATVAARDTVIAERDAAIAERNAAIAERDTAIAERDGTIAERDAQLSQALAVLESDKTEFGTQVAEFHRQRETMLASIRLYEHRVKAYEASTSWRLTAPVRMVGRTVQRLNRVVRMGSHRLELTRCAPVQMSDTPTGHADWYEVTSPRRRMPDRWVSLTYSGPAYDGTVFLTFYLDHGDGHWHPIGLPSIKGRLEGHIFRLSDGYLRMCVKVQGSDQALSGPPQISLREIGQAELLSRLVWSRRQRLPNALRYLMKNGPRATVARAAESFSQQSIDLYHRWIETYDTLSDADRAAIAAHAATLPQTPLISILVPVYNTPEAYLREMLDSVLKQLYPNWELCLADDASTEPHVRAVLAEYAARDARVKVIHRPENGHISAASNSALELATGSYIALLDHDDLLPEHALYLVAVAINDHPDADVFYSDEDKIDDQGRRTEPYFKPDFGHELLLGQNYVSHLGVYRAEAIREVGGFRLGFEGSQDYDLVLRIVARTKAPVVHLPWVLYHWRLFPGAATFSSTQIEKASDSARKALREHLAGRGVAATVEPWVHAYHRAIRDDLPVWPKVSAIVPTRDHVDVLRTCVEGLLQRTDYPDIELIIANNDSREPETLAYFDTLRADPRVRIFDYPGAFNFSAINNAAIAVSTGEIVLLLNNDIEMIDAGWLKQMVKHAVRPEVGAVGAKLLYPDNTMQHGSVVLGMNGVAGHLHVGVPHDSPGYFGWLRIAHNVSCVTAACLAMRRTVFDEIGGLDEVNLKVAFNDVDLCMKVTGKGYEIIWTPEATLYHWESKSRGNDMSAEHFGRFQGEVAYMRERWGPRLDRDPFFNPNLSLATAHPVVAFPPRRAVPWQPFLKPA